MKAWLDQAEIDNFIASQDYYNEDYKGTKTLSKQPWYDDMFGNTMTMGIVANNPFGTFAPVETETKEHKYKGQIVINPGDIRRIDILETIEDYSVVKVLNWIQHRISIRQIRMI